MIKKVAGVQFNPWDHVYHFDSAGIILKVGEFAVIKVENTLEIGRVISISDVDERSLDSSLTPVVRRATEDDLKRYQQLEEKKSEIIEKAKEAVLRLRLEMKLVDCYFSFDGGKITLVFTAEGRVDFRELVRDLARLFQKSIRLQQIGIRDEARRLGGMGHCGRELCCRKFLNNLTSVTTEYARVQQVASRGSDRISGACGRLMCCLSYELDYYQEALKKFPKPDSQAKTRQGTGRVVSCNVIKGTVNLDIDGNYVEVPVKEVKQL